MRTPIRLPLALALVVVAGCDARRPLAPAPGAPSADVLAPAEAARRRLERAAGDLLYMSESDYPFTYFSHAGPFAEPVTVEEFRDALGIAADTPVEVISLDAFFARHIERVDPYDDVAVALVPRYRRLRETIRRSVRGAQVFRVGTIQITCYAVGVDRAGSLVGMTTIAIET